MTISIKYQNQYVTNTNTNTNTNLFDISNLILNPITIPVNGNNLGPVSYPVLVLPQLRLA